MDREALLERENEAWLKFADTFAAVPSDRREAQGVVPGWSTHDLVWHCVYWADYAGDMLERIQRRRPGSGLLGRSGGRNPRSGTRNELG